MGYCTLSENVSPGTCPVCEAELKALRRVVTAAREKHREYTEVLIGDGRADRELGSALDALDLAIAKYATRSEGTADE